MYVPLTALHRLAQPPLVACLSILLATTTVGSAAARLRAGSMTNVRLAAPTLVVANCNDDGAGSLRATIAAASPGDTIDLSALTCGTISLTTGYIGIAQDDLTLVGPGAALLAIDAGSTSGVLRHTGAGTLSLSGLTISHGQYSSATAPLGGCLYSASNLDISDSTVSYCAAVGTGVTTLGGGIYTKGDLTLTSSIVTRNQVQSTGAVAHGGGVYVHGNFDAEYSVISYNLTAAGPLYGGRGGGAMIVGATTIRHSTISDNSAYAVGGLYTQDAVTVDSSTISYNGASHAAGMRAIYTTGSPTATIVNSTIANNQSVATVGGLNLIIPATISNSTIAFNNAFNGLGGILMSGPTLDLESTIIADNIAFNVPDDFDVYGSPVIIGANNLVIASSAALPPDTIPDDPLLGTLSDNGGQTLTIPLLATSPAIDAGNNVAQIASDQRGPGFRRVSGARADIGAFEVQPTDVIFADGFDPP